METTFSTIEDLTYLIELVKKNYDPKRSNCIGLAKILSSIYSNLVPYQVETFIYDGEFHIGGHVVLKVQGTSFLIDPVGDYASATRLVALKNNIVPWIYIKNKQNDLYVSQNHFPVSSLNLLTESSVLECPFDNVRSITLQSEPFLSM